MDSSKGVEHNGGYRVNCDSRLDAVCKGIMLYYIFHVTFPPAATACYRFLARLVEAPYTNTNEAALQILYPNS